MSVNGVWIFSLIVILIVFVDVSVPSGARHDRVVVCYVSTWAVYRPSRGSFDIENINPSLCTHLIYAFAGLNATTDSIKSLDPWQDLTDDFGKGGFKRMASLRHRYPHIKVSLAIGGWNEGSSNYSALVSDSNRRKKFVATAVEFIKKYNFDGLDLDWEFPGKRGGAATDKTNFLLLVKELRAAFSKHNLLLTAAFGAGISTIDVAYDVAGLSVYLDYIHMMCYDFHGAWDQKTGSNAPLHSHDDLNIESSIMHMLKLGAPPKKLVLGVPLYGRTFLLSNPLTTVPGRKPKLGDIAGSVGFQGPFTRENGFMGYNEICLELKNKTAWTQHWDELSETPFAVSNNQIITFDNEKSIYKKVKLAMEKDLAGIMVWSIDTDDFQGDCVDATNNESEINYPLMRSINKAIEETLEDIKRDKENVIPHGNESDSGASTTRISINLVFFSSLLYYIFRYNL